MLYPLLLAHHHLIPISYSDLLGGLENQEWIKSANLA